MLHNFPHIDETSMWSQMRMLNQDALPFRQQDWPLTAPPVARGHGLAGRRRRAGRADMIAVKALPTLRASPRRPLMRRSREGRGSKVTGEKTPAGGKDARFEA